MTSALSQEELEPGQAFARDVANALVHNVAEVIRGKDEVIQLVVAGLISSGHVLLEDVPGVGKTLLMKALTNSVGASFGRIQGTPDLLPADITGTSVFHRSTEQWEFRAGPIFHNMVLFDELNRATPRTQSALLESMEEGNVSVDGVTRPLPKPWFCLATQNPSTERGTFQIPQSQLDRFALSLSMGLAARSAERDVLLKKAGNAALSSAGQIVSADDLQAVRATVDEVHAAAPLVEYVLDLVEAVRKTLAGRAVATRASVSLLQTSRGLAILAGRGFVIPDDVRRVAPFALSHRLNIEGSPDLGRREIVNEAIASVVPPRV